MTDEEAVNEVEYAYDLLIPWWYGLSDYERLIGEDITEKEWEDFRDFIFENDLAGDLIPHIRQWWNDFKEQSEPQQPQEVEKVSRGKWVKNV